MATIGPASQDYQTILKLVEAGEDYGEVVTTADLNVSAAHLDGQVEGISGATILGDGSVALILDVLGIIHMAMKNAYQSQQHLNNETATEEAEH